MDDPRQSNELAGRSKPLDYLSQWLNLLGDTYPGPSEMTALAFTAYRLTLGELTEAEIQIAFTETFKRHKTGFRPAPGEILEYLREARMEKFYATPALPALPEGDPLDEEARSKIGEMLKDLGSKMATWWNSGRKDCVVEITDEMRERNERIKREALERFGKTG